MILGIFSLALAMCCLFGGAFLICEMDDRLKCNRDLKLMLRAAAVLAFSLIAVFFITTGCDLITTALG